MIIKTSYSFMKPPPSARLIRGHRLAQGLVGAWTMAEDGGLQVFDLSGNGLTGTLGGNAAWVAGKFGPAIAFAPGSDFIDLGKPNVGSNFSISIWAYSTGPSAYNGNDGYFLCDSTDATNLYFRRHADRSSEIELGIGETGEAGIPSSVDTWHHYVIVHKSSGDFYVYQDGILIRTGSGSNFAGFTSNLYIGNRADVLRDFDGKLDVPMVWNRALNASEIAELYWKLFGMLERKARTALMSGYEVVAPPVGMAGAMTTNTGYWGY